MTILNETELKAKNQLLFQTGLVGGTTTAKLREYNIDSIDSMQSYSGVIIGVVVDNVTVDNTGSVWTEFSHDGGAANQLISTDHSTGTLTVSEPGVYFVTVRFNGKWSAGEDLNFEVLVNGSSTPMTPVVFAQEGQGSSDPVLISVTDVELIVDSAMILAGAGSADITLFVKSTTGTFDVDQTTVTFKVRYNPLSIRTVG
jgi:hypothetical protein